MYGIRGISKSFRARTVLADVSFTLRDGEKAALVGPNGVGKSTLLGIMAGVIEPDRGSLMASAGARLGHLPQQLRARGNGTIGEHLRQVSGVGAAEVAFEQAMSAVAAGSADLETLADAQSRFEEAGGYFFESCAQAVLEGLGVADLARTHPLSTLSGGQKSTVSLARILLRGLDLLLLDEPTNNLDLPALVWLEQTIANTRGILHVPRSIA